MTLMDWKERFEPWILERGRRYWKSGYVSDLSNDGSSVTAIVSGTEDYEVEIEKRDGNVTYMSCTCPYADAGNNCKHMAAVVFAMDEDLTGQFSIRRDNEGNQRLPWEEALDQLSLDEMRQLLFELAQTERNIQERIAMLHGQIAPEVLEKIWGTQLAEIPRKYTDRHGFIDYQNAYDFFCELDDFLNERFPRLLQTGQVLEGFRLTCMVFETAMEQDVDDSDGGSGLIVSSCEQMWREILDLANSEQEQEIYSWFASHTIIPEWDFGTEIVEQILYEWKWSKPLLERNLKLLDVQLGRDDVSDYRMEKLLNWRTGIMEELGASQEELAAFWKRYCYLPYVRKRELDFLMQAENYGEAINLLTKSKEMDKSNDFLVRNYSQKLIFIYQKTGKTEELKEELRFQILSCYQQDLTYIKLYRGAIPAEEWPDFFEKLLIHPTTK